MVGKPDGGVQDGGGHGAAVVRAGSGLEYRKEPRIMLLLRPSDGIWFLSLVQPVAEAGLLNT